MTAPQYVPVKAIDDTRLYTSPPRRPGSWTQDRPAELLSGQPRGDRLGSPGPDQGFALTLAERDYGFRWLYTDGRLGASGSGACH